MPTPIHILLVCFLSLASFARAAESRPNILWLTCEDMGPHLGCFGDAYATTPNLNHLAQRSLRYTKAWSNAPVCAPARTALISGMHPTSTGSEHMRSLVRLPAEIELYPQLLRKAGYYCTNNSKEDYNLTTQRDLWDESSPNAHWKKRPAGKPFFAVFNFTVTHESQIRRPAHQLIHDPAQVRVPRYHPDAVEIRRDWARYYDTITTMDEQVGVQLQALEKAGLAEETIVFFYSDHGSGMPRSKRWPYDSGLRVPLIIHFPKKYRHLSPKGYEPGSENARLVSFVDFAPTVLSLAGLRPPQAWHGQAFLGPFATAPREYVHGFRGRMDERYDLVRSIRDERYIYIRNYMPHRIYGQHIDYMFQTPTTRVWRKLYDEGRLKPPQTYFWETKPPEELYDLAADPDEVCNLAASPDHQEVVARLRRAQRDQVLGVRDLGFLPEDELHHRSTGLSPYQLGRDQDKYPVERIVAIAELAASFDAEAVPRLVEALGDRDSAVRYWGALGLRARGKTATAVGHAALLRALTDEAPSVRIVAAEALAKFGGADELKSALDVLLKLAPVQKNGVYVSLQALNALDELQEKARPGLALIRTAAQDPNGVTPPRLQNNLPRLVEKIVRDLGH